MALGNLCVKPKETPSVKISNGVFILWVLIRNCLISVIIASPFFFFLFFLLQVLFSFLVRWKCHTTKTDCENLWLVGNWIHKSCQPHGVTG